MRLGFLSWANAHTGLGHWFRCLALAEAAFNRGHRVTFISDRQVNNPRVLNCDAEYLNQEQIEFWTSRLSFDWLVVDIPDQIPEWIWGISANKCVIDGIGHEAQKKADLNISQGFGNAEYGAPDYVLLRRLAPPQRVDPAPCDGMFVFGGGADKLGLAARFIRSCPDIPANIVVSPLAELQQASNSPLHNVYRMNGDKIFTVIQASTSAAVHHGMIVWELVSMRLAPHVFSYSVNHYENAKQMEDAGYVLAYDAVGLPEGDEPLRDFLLRPAVLTGKPIDGRGAERVIKLMERRIT